MKNENHLDRQKVTNSEEIEIEERKNKRLILLALAAIIAGTMAITGVKGNIENAPAEPAQEVEIGTEVEIEKVEPKKETRYIIPAGYTIATIDGEVVGVKTVCEVTPDGIKETIVTIPISEETIYYAEPGFIYDGEGCYKYENPTESSTLGR